MNLNELNAMPILHRLYMFSVVFLLIACGGKTTDTEQPESSLPLNTSVKSLNELSGQFWFMFGEYYAYIDESHRMWQVSINTENDDIRSCHQKEEYIGELKSLDETGYAIVGADFSERSLRINLAEGNLILTYSNANVSSYEKTTAYDGSIPAECTPGFEMLPDGATPVTDLSLYSGVLENNNRDSVNTRYVLTISDKSEIELKRHYGSNSTRGPDCYDESLSKQRLISKGSGEYWSIFDDGSIAQQRVFIKDGALSFSQGLISDDYTLTEERINDLSDCANEEAATANATAINDLTQIAGIYDVSYALENGAVDKYYLQIDEGGAAELYNLIGDGYNEGENCFIKEPYALITNNDTGAYDWEPLSLSSNYTYFSGQVNLYKENDDLLIANRNYVQRYLKSTLAERDLAVLCTAVRENGVPAGSKPVRDLSELVGLWDSSILTTGTDFLDISPHGFVTLYSIKAGELCYRANRDSSRLLQTADFQFQRRSEDLAEPVDLRVFLFENELYFSDDDSVFQPKASDMTAGEIQPLCFPQPTPSEGSVPIDSLESMVGVWDYSRLSSDGSRVITERYLIVDEGGSIRYADDIRVVDCYRIPASTDTLEYLRPGEFASTTNNGNSTRINAFLNNGNLVIVDGNDIQEYTPAPPLALPRCLSIEDVPPEATPINTLDPFYGVKDLSSTSDEGLTDEFYWFVTETGRIDLYDFLGDTAQQLGDCYADNIIDTKISIGDDNMIVLTSFGGTETSYQGFFTENIIYLVNDFEYIEVKSSALSLEDLNPICIPDEIEEDSEAISELSSMAGTWEQFIGTGDDEEFSIHFIDEAGNVDKYIENYDPVTEEVCYEKQSYTIEYITNNSFVLRFSLFSYIAKIYDEDGDIAILFGGDVDYLGYARYTREDVEPSCEADNT